MASLMDDVSQFLDDSNKRSILILLAIVTLLASLYNHRRRRTTFPIANPSPWWDIFHRTSHSQYISSTHLLTQNITHPITLLTPSGPHIILPSSALHWVKSNPHLDHKRLVRREFFADLPGFEGIRAVVSHTGILVDTVKRHLASNAKLVPLMDRFVGEAVDELWGWEAVWKEVDFGSTTTKLISRIVAPAFVGEHLARDTEWQEMMIEYVGNYFAAVFELKKYPTWMRTLIHWVLPQARKCRELVGEVREKVKSEKERRLRVEKKEKGAGDAIEWSEELNARRAHNEGLDQAAVQLGFAVAALHTTAEQLRRVLLDLCLNPDMVEPLREEIEAAIRWTDGRVSAATLARMELLDSVLKESQRMHPPSVVNLEREVSEDTYLDDGTLIPKGTILAVSASEMWDPSIYPEPEKFDGYRFLRLRRSGNDRVGFVSSTQEQCVFGMGKHICPGRFLADVELKLCLIHVLEKFDLRLKEGYEAMEVKNGFYRMVDPGARVEVKRRAKKGFA